MALLARLQARDPDLLNLRKAARATLVSVSLFAVLKLWLGLAGVATFAFFASFVGLVFADFGGRPRSRMAAYAALIVIGNLVIVLGSLLSDTIVGAAVAMFLVMFAASFATVFGGYTPAFIAPMALAYSLTVLDPLGNFPIDGRVLGWTIGGAAALVAAQLLWPVDPRLTLRETLASVCKGLGQALAAIGDRDAAEAAYGAAAKAMSEARGKASAPLRPAGPLSHDIGLFHLVEHLEQAARMTRQILDRSPPLQREVALIAACADALCATGAALAGKASPVAMTRSMAPLDAAISADRAAAGAESASEALAQVRHALPAFGLAHVAMWVEAAAAMALGARDTVAVSGSAAEPALSDRPVELVRRTARFALGAFDRNGVIFRNSIRAAVAMTIAVVLAKLLPVEHGFWITLGALLVLRSSATTTSLTALQAIAGTLVGFVVAAAILIVIGKSATLLWVILPFTIFLAGYTPGAVGFAVGQASFTTALVVLFTLIDPAGIATAVVRVETVTVGAVSAAVIGLILWPRGARAALAAALAQVYRASAQCMRALVTGSDEGCRRAASGMLAARRQADDAFGVALSERGRPIEVGLWLGLFQAPNLVYSLACGLVPQPAPWVGERCGAALAAIAAQRDRVAGALERTGDRLDPTHARATAPPSPEPPVDPAPILEDCFERARPLGPEGVDNIRSLFAWNQWLSLIETDIAAAKPDLDVVAAVSKPQGWLRWSVPSAKGG